MTNDEEKNDDSSNVKPNSADLTVTSGSIGTGKRRGTGKPTNAMNVDVEVGVPFDSGKKDFKKLKQSSNNKCFWTTKQTKVRCYLSFAHN